MPQGVSSVNAADNPQKVQDASSSSSKPAPQGISSDASTMQSLESPKSEGILKQVSNAFINIFKSIKNLFMSIFYRIYYCKAPPSEIELKYSDFQSRLHRVDSLSEELAIKEANEFPVIYTYFGQHVFKKSYNFAWKIWTCIPYLGHKNYYEIGRKEAQKDYKALIPHLKSYYKSQALRLEDRINKAND